MGGQWQEAGVPRSPHHVCVGCLRKGHASNSDAHLSVSRAISFILTIWLVWYPEDFFRPSVFFCLEMLLAYIKLNFLGSDLEMQAQLRLLELKLLEPHEADPEGEEDSSGDVGM